MRPRGRVGFGPSRRTSAWDGAAMWVGMLSVTPCAGSPASSTSATSSVIDRVMPRPPRLAARSWRPRLPGW